MSAEPRTFRPQYRWIPAGAKFDFHPASEEYELHSDPERVADMKANGYDAHFPIALQGDKIVAGRGRYIDAAKAGVDFAVFELPTMVDPWDFAKRENEQRRHETKEEIERRRERRRERVASAMAEGRTVREIAEAEKVSVGAIQGDIKSVQTERINASTDKQLSVLTNTKPSPNGRETGKKPSAPAKILCSRCQRIGSQVKDCLGCKESRAAKKQVHKSESQEQEDDSPEGRMKEANSLIESFCRQVMKLVDEQCPDDPWLKDLGRRDAAIQKFRDACSTLRTAKCHAVCPKCEGEGCVPCRKTGRVPKATYDQLV